MIYLTRILDKIANTLEAQGLQKLAMQVDVVTNTLDGDAGTLRHLGPDKFDMFVDIALKRVSYHNPFTSSPYMDYVQSHDKELYDIFDKSVDPVTHKINWVEVSRKLPMLAEWVSARDFGDDLPTETKALQKDILDFLCTDHIREAGSLGYHPTDRTSALKYYTVHMDAFHNAPRTNAVDPEYDSRPPDTTFRHKGYTWKAEYYHDGTPSWVTQVSEV